MVALKSRLHSWANGFVGKAITLHPAAVIFLTGIALNVALAIAIPTVDLSNAGETPRIAASVATGGGFSSPFRQATGPSAWVPPIYAYLLAGIFSLFGVFTVTSYWVAVAINVIIHALSCVVLYSVAGETFGRRTGWYAALALASFPLLSEPLVLLHLVGGYLGQGLFIPPNAIWNTHFSELAILVLIWVTLRLASWVIYGATWGLAALINPTVLALAPAYFLAWRLRHRQRWCALALAIASAALCVAPWLLRNYLVFNRLVFIRDNFGVELRVGNQPGSRGLWSETVHPDGSAYELSRVVQMGEAEYARVAGSEAMDSIRARPAEFARDTILRIVYFWTGAPMTSRSLKLFAFMKYLPQSIFSLLALYGACSALRRRARGAFLFATILVFYPLIHYITHVSYGNFYQWPIQPVMLALACSVFFREAADGHAHAESEEALATASLGRVKS